MANKQLQIELQLKTDAAKKALTDLTNLSRQALNPNSSTSAFIKENQALDQMNAKLKLLVGVQSQLANQKGMSQEYAKVGNEIASILASQKKMVTTEEQYLKILQAETAARKAASSAFVSSHSERQAGLLQDLKGGGSQVFGATGLPGGGLIGATGPLGVLTTAATQLAKVFDDMGKKAEETAKIISDSGGKYDQVAASALKVKQANDRLADDPVFAAFEKFKNDLQSVGIDTLKRGIDLFAQAVDHLPGIGRSDEQRTADAKKAADAEKGRVTKLKGDALVEYENLKHDRISMEKEIAMSEQEFAVETERKKRDLALETKEFEIQQQNKLFDLQKAGAREQRDYQHNLQKLNADVEFKASQEKYDLERKNERQVFNLKQSDDAARFQRQLGYDQAEFQRQQQYKAQDFAIASGRKLEDYATNLNRMALTGGGSATDYLFGAQDFRKEQRRASQDYQLQTGREAAEFGIKKGQEKTEFGISQTQERRNQAIEQELKAKEHSIDVETHLYSLKQQEYELTTKHNDAVQDNIEALRRLSVETDIGRQKLANKASDLAQDTALTRQKMDFDEAEKRRSQSNKEFDFGGNLANQLPAGDLQNLMKSNPELAKFIQGDFSRKGLPMPSAGKSSVAGGSMGGDAVAAVQAYIAAHPELSKEAKDFLKGLTGNEVQAFADGGHTSGSGKQLAFFHPGEYIINPNATDKLRQQHLWKQAGQEMGLIPAYADGGIIGLPKKAFDRVLADQAKNQQAISSGGDSAPQDDYTGRFNAFVANILNDQASSRAKHQAEMDALIAQTGGGGGQAGHAGFGYGPGGANGLVPINPSDHAGFGYGRGGATGLVPLTATNNGTANGAPLSAMPMPINMPGGGGAGGVYNVQIGGNNNYNFDGFPPELKSKLQAMEQSHQQDMQRMLQQTIGGSFNTMRRVQGYQQ